MKKRILTGWTFSRALYALMGIFIIIQSVMQREWIGILPGVYFAAMGIFSFGCAAGNCFGGSCYNQPKPDSTSTEEIKFEEIK